MSLDGFRLHLAHLESDYERLEAENLSLRKLLADGSARGNMLDDLLHGNDAERCETRPISRDVESIMPVQVFQRDGIHQMIGVVPAKDPPKSLGSITSQNVDVHHHHTPPAVPEDQAADETEEGHLPGNPGSKPRVTSPNTLEPRSSCTQSASSSTAATVSQSPRSSFMGANGSVTSCSRDLDAFKKAYTSELSGGNRATKSFEFGILGGGLGKRASIFPDTSEMKERLRQQIMKKKYDVADFYKVTGYAQWMARSQVFEIMTLFIIATNSIWIAVDTDYNHAELLIEASWGFQFVENLFCVYFSFEILIRFCAFQTKRNCMKDAWFVFDSSLVVLMVLETWILVLSLRVSGEWTMSNLSVLRIAKLFRLTRMARLARLLRAIPELCILIKGMCAAARSVFFTLLLLLTLLYVFGIAFTQLLRGSVPGQQYFPGVAVSMNTLWLYATLMEEVTALSHDLQDVSLWVVFLLDAYILAASLTVMNMLVGVLCEVVSAVAAQEREVNSLSFMKSRIERVFYTLGIDTDHNGMISRSEFKKIVENPDAAKAISDLGVDVLQLVDMADLIFADEGGSRIGGYTYEKELSFSEFMDTLAQFRGQNGSTVKDIMQLRKFIRKELDKREVPIARATQAPSRSRGTKDSQKDTLT